jgi:hypothetical protein
MNNLVPIVETAMVVVSLTTLVVILSARRAPTMFGRVPLPDGRIRWDDQKGAKAEKGKGAKVRGRVKENLTNGTLGIARLLRAVNQTMGYATIIRVGTVTANMGLTVTSSTKGQLVGNEKNLPNLLLLKGLLRNQREGKHH